MTDTTAHVTVQYLAAADPISAAEFAPWLPTFTRWVNEVGPSAAAMDADWLTGQGLSTLATIEQRNTRWSYFGGRPQGFSRLPTTRRYFVDWLNANGQTAPDPVAVPQGNGFDEAAFLALDPEVRIAQYSDDLIRFLTTDRQQHWANAADVRNILQAPRSFLDEPAAYQPDRCVLRRFITAITEGRFTLTAAAAAPTTTEEAPITDTTPAAEQVIVPIGPDHPDWQRFAEQMAAVATRHGMCPEYDRIARLMGLPVRREKIVTRITLEVETLADAGHNVDDRALREAAKALLERNGSVSRSNRFEVRREQVVAAAE